MCCISAGFAKIATPCVACTKVVGSAFAVGLIFTFNFFGIDIEGDWPIVLILLAGFFALIWFLIVYCSGGLTDKKDDEFEYMVKYFTPMCDPKQVGAPQTLDIEKRSYTNELAATCQQIDVALMELFTTMALHSIIIICIFLFISIWLIESNARWAYFISVIFGAIAITLIVFSLMKIASRSLSRILIEGTQSKENVYVIMFMCGFAAISIALASTFLFFIFIYYLYRQGLVPGLIETKDYPTIEELGMACCGYALGFIVSAFVYRESLSILSRGMQNSDRNLGFNNLYISHPARLLYIIQSLMQTQVINVIDASLCIVVLIVSSFVILSNSNEILASELIFTSLLAPTIYLSVNFLCQIIVQLFKIAAGDDDITEFTMKNSRLMVIITNVVALFIFLTMPVMTFIAEFTLTGEPDSSAIIQTTKTLSQNSIVFSCLIGQLCSLILLIYLEWITSHGCPPVRNLAISSVERIGIQNLNYSQYLSNFGGSIALIIFALTVIGAYSIAGWIGLMGASVGFIANYFIYIPILYVGAMAGDTYRLCCMAQVNTIVSEKLQSIAWAARNYAIYVRLTSAGGSILLALCFLGCSIFEFQKDPYLFTGFTGIFGIIMGILLTICYRGICIGAIISISKQYNINLYKSGVAVHIAQDDTINNYLKVKLMLALQFIYGIFILYTLLIIFIGFELGYQAIVGIEIGIIVMTLFFMFQSLIGGTSLKNALYFNENNDQISKRDSIYNYYVQADLHSSVVDESATLPLIVFMLYTVLFIFIGSKYFATDGDFYKPPVEAM